jgi:broad specificity phosphatase PhoE
VRLIYLSHPESAVNPLVPVPNWGLSARGIARATALAARWPFGSACLWASPERKAQDCAAICAYASGNTVKTLPESHEIDRNATGFVPAARHDALAHRLFRHPNESAEGWERAVDAQTRIVKAVTPLIAQSCKSLILIGHGGVGTLLWLHLTGQPITPAADQPRQGCGWVYDLGQQRAIHGWRAFEAL